jgi:hypothetical protein
MPVTAFVDLVPDLMPDLVRIPEIDFEGVFELAHYLSAVEDYLFEQSTDCAL